MPLAPFVLSLLLAPQALPFAAHVDALRDVERARYRFTLEATLPFDEVFPRAVFEALARRREDRERVLKTRFFLEVPREALEKELERIERSTTAPDQWEAVKKALGDDREKILQVFCRPLVVERALRRAFAFDRGIHAMQHEEARAARNAFRRGEAASGSMELRLARSGEGALSPDVQAVLERELKSPGDVTTILEEADRFSVFRLVALDSGTWSVIGVRIPKRGFDTWFEETRQRR